MDIVEVGECTLFQFQFTFILLSKRQNLLRFHPQNILRFFPDLFCRQGALHFTYPVGFEPTARHLALLHAQMAGAVNHCTTLLYLRLLYSLLFSAFLYFIFVVVLSVGRIHRTLALLRSLAAQHRVQVSYSIFLHVLVQLLNTESSTCVSCAPASP